MTGLLHSIQQRDEARPTTMEVILGYPGYHIMTVFHPAAHFLWRHNLRAIARLWSNIGRLLTGIEIHPGAQIGKNFFIDHGMSVVIGQTAEIGDNCRIYHGVTLGGKSDRLHGQKRHPTLGNEVIIGAGAQVLGPITIGEHARVGANAVVTTDVPPHMTAVGNPATLIGEKDAGDCAYGLPEGDIPDPIAAAMQGMARDIEMLKAELGRLRN